MTTPTPQDAPQENGPKEALKRLSHPAMQKALKAICALIDDKRSPDSSGVPPAPKQIGITYETAKEIFSKLLGLPCSSPGAVTVSGYIVTTEGYKLALDGKNDFIAVHGSKVGAENEVVWLMEVQSDRRNNIIEIRPVRLEVLQVAQDVTDDATDDRHATTDATPDYSEHWWDPQLQQQLKELVDTVPDNPAVNGTAEHAPIPAPLDCTESRKLVERLIQDEVCPDSPQRRNRLRGRRAAFIERFVTVIALLAAVGFGYWLAYLARVDAAFEKGRADKAIELRHEAEMNASESARLFSEETTLRLQTEQFAEKKVAAAEKQIRFSKRMQEISRDYVRRARDELTGLKDEGADQIAGEPFIALRIAGEIFRESGAQDDEFMAYYHETREVILSQLARFLYPDTDAEEMTITLGTESPNGNSSRFDR